MKTETFFNWPWQSFFETTSYAFTMIINLGLCLPLILQIKEQKKRLMRVEEIERVKKRTFANDAASFITRGTFATGVQFETDQ